MQIRTIPVVLKYIRFGNNILRKIRRKSIYCKQGKASDPMASPLVSRLETLTDAGMSTIGDWQGDAAASMRDELSA